MEIIKDVTSSLDVGYKKLKITCKFNDVPVEMEFYTSEIDSIRLVKKSKSHCSSEEFSLFAMHPETPCHYYKNIKL